MIKMAIVLHIYQQSIAYHPPTDLMPRAIRQAKQNWPKKIRKNNMKLKLESDLKAL